MCSRSVHFNSPRALWILWSASLLSRRACVVVFLPQSNRQIDRLCSYRVPSSSLSSFWGASLNVREPFFFNRGSRIFIVVFLVYGFPWTMTYVTHLLPFQIISPSLCVFSWFFSLCLASMHFFHACEAQLMSLMYFLFVFCHSLCVFQTLYTSSSFFTSSDEVATHTTPPSAKQIKLSFKLRKCQE